jgi:hypothetical protein
MAIRPHRTPFKTRQERKGEKEKKKKKKEKTKKGAIPVYLIWYHNNNSS